MAKIQSDLKKMRLLYVVHTLNPGGTEQLAVKMAIHFSQKYEVFVLCLDEPGLWSDKLRSQGIHVSSLWRQPGFDLRIAIRIASFCRRYSINAIHAHQFTPWHYVVISRFFYPFVQILLEEHGRHYPEVENHKRVIFNRFIGQYLTRTFVGVSQDIRERMFVYEGINKDRIKVIYNGSETVAQVTKEDYVCLKRSLGLSSNDLVVGTVGRFDPIKNLPLLLRTIKECSKQHKDIKLLLVGDGPEMKSVRRLIDDLGINKRVVLTGYRNDATRLTAIMDLFVLASYSEGTSMALLESMAAGIPAVVTNVGGNPEIVLSGHTGWVVPSDNLPAMVEALKEAITDSESRYKYGKAAQDRFLSNFSLQRMFAAYEEVYSKMENM